MSEKQVTILIPNYKTPDITKICLRLIRRYTDLNQAEIIVIDNNSNDDSTAYLRTIPWISLVERKPMEEETGPQSHSKALDLALEQVKTPYVLSIHTDTFVKDSQWLDILLAPFINDPSLAGVGSWKLESKNKLQMFGYHFEQKCKYLLAKFFGYSRYNADRLDINARYLRSHCAMYRTDIIKQLDTNFSDGDTTAGKTMHKKMLKAGYNMLFLPSETLGQYVDHLNHATMVLNPELGSKEKSIKNGQKRIQKALRGIDANSILADDSLDH